MLAFVAPPSFQRPLLEALEAAGIQAARFRRPEPRGGADPYQLGALARRLEGRAEALLLVAPARRSPRTVAPGPVVEGLPVGLLFAREPAELSSWLAAVRCARSPQAPRAVLAAWDEHYLRLGRRFARHLRTAHARSAVTWFADRLNRLALLERLARGPTLAAYFGHGLTDGLGGYHGVYREHFEAQERWRPCGVFVTWACDTLKQERAGGSFGRFLVESGRAAGFLGATAAVRTLDNAALAERAGELLGHRKPMSLGCWARAIDEALEAGSPAWRAWRTYRILGSPWLAL